MWSTMQSLCEKTRCLRSLVPLPYPQTVLPPTCYQWESRDADRHHSTSYASNVWCQTLVMSPNQAVQRTTATLTLPQTRMETSALQTQSHVVADCGKGPCSVALRPSHTQPGVVLRIRAPKATKWTLKKKTWYLRKLLLVWLTKSS